MFNKIKERIEDLIISVQDEYEEIQLKKWLKTFEIWGKRWRLDNLRFPEMDIMNSFNEKEWRN